MARMSMRSLKCDYNCRKDLIKDMMQYLEEQTCFKFIEKSSQRDYLDIRKEDGCYSYVGRVGGPQLLSLSKGCFRPYIIQHELLHALGLEHEHQRHDRDKYIKVNYRNVQKGKEDNFDKIPSHLVELYGQPYDYNSIMHYDSRAFGKFDWNRQRKLETMLPLKERITINDNHQLSELDLAKLRILGKCPQNENELKYAGRKGNGQIKEKDDECRDVSLSCTERLCHLEPYTDLMGHYCVKTCKLCS
uniref:Metalloendopeptidase n=1 Tax=Bursaphelenchus xylophilus TaxID=6326 RepID=A0A1I7RHH9_BURXY